MPTENKDNIPNSMLNRALLVNKGVVGRVLLPKGKGVWHSLDEGNKN
jgi:hypothetical protein